MPKVLICCDSFKGTLTSLEVNSIIFNELIKHGFECEAVPMADGGEGSLELIEQAIDTERIKVISYNPYHKPVEISYLVSGDKAYIEMAGINGLTLVPELMRKPLQLSSYGTGVVLRHAIESGVRDVTIFLGGSATVDGGVGMLYGLMDCKLPDVNPLIKTDFSMFEEVKECLKHIYITLVTDVNNAIVGEYGAAKVFGPQKGATDIDVIVLDTNMVRWTEILENVTLKELKDIKGLGAAGGVGLPLYALSNVRIIQGYDYFSRLFDYPTRLRRCDILITGEGCIDDQTMMGKGPGRLAEEAHRKGKIVLGVGGMVISNPIVFHKVFSTIESDNDNIELKPVSRLQYSSQQMALYLKKCYK